MKHRDNEELRRELNNCNCMISQYIEIIEKLKKEIECKNATIKELLDYISQRQRFR